MGADPLERKKRLLINDQRVKFLKEMHEGSNYGVYAVLKSISYQKGPLMQVAYNNQEEFSFFSACREQLENIIVALLSSERAA